MTTVAENKLSLKFLLLFIPVAFASYLFHEFGHWIVGEALGYKMAYSLNGVWPISGHFISANQDLLVNIGGPAFSILLALVFLLVIEKYKVMWAYPFVFFQLVFRFLSLVVGGFGLEDEAKISAIPHLGTYTVAIIVLLLLFLMVWRASYVLRINLKNNSYIFTMGTLCDILVIGTSRLLS